MIIDFEVHGVKTGRTTHKKPNAEEVESPTIKALRGAIARGDKIIAGRRKAADIPTVIHVNQNVIRSNHKHGRNDPTLTVRVGRRGKDVRRAHRVKIDGPSEIIHSMHDPLPCGARVWIETFAKVSVE